MGIRENDFEPLPNRSSSSSSESSKSANTSSKPNYELRFKMCLCCVWICIGLIGWLCFLYYSSVMDERDEIDISNTSIAEPLLDKTTDKHVNCTQEKPCKYTCIYVKKHFNRTPEDCEYTDYFDIISTILEILIGIAILGCLSPKQQT